MPAANGTGDAGVFAGLRQRYRRWVDRRIPRAREVTLNQKRLFIFPTRAGLFFAFSLLIMLLTAINYQNNMSFALTFLLANLFVVAVLHTYANLAGLTVRAVRAQSVFPGQQSEFEISLSGATGKQHTAVHVGWPDSGTEFVTIEGESSRRVSLYRAVGGRGWYRPGRLLLESSYPLGLLRCWTWIDLDLRAMVYPRPLPSGPLPGVASQTPDGAAEPVDGDDDFYGFRPYRAGDSLKRVHWKGLAKGQALQSRIHNAYADRSVWLEWDLFPHAGIEQKLSYLCYWVLEFDRANEEYGLRLPGVTIAPDTGVAHRDRVLQALALYGVES